jgi:hypothetical protein
MNSMNFQGNSASNVFGQNFSSNLNSNSKQEKIYSTDNSKRNLNNFLMEKEKYNKEKDKEKENRETSQSKINSRLDNIKEKFEIFRLNNRGGEKDEIDSSLNLLKEKISRKTNNNNNNNPNNLSNINNISNTTNSVTNSNNNNNNNYNNNYNTNNHNQNHISNNKINVITPASSRDCGVFDSNFVLKTDKRSFLLNENTIDTTKRKTSEDK